MQKNEKQETDGSGENFLITHSVELRVWFPISQSKNFVPLQPIPQRRDCLPSGEGSIQD